MLSREEDMDVLDLIEKLRGERDEAVRLLKRGIRDVGRAWPQSVIGKWKRASKDYLAKLGGTDAKP